MQSKNLFVLVDNRSKTAQESYSELKGAPLIDFKGSAFKATEIDAEQEHQTLNLNDYSFLSQLQMKVEELQQRIQNLQKSQVVHIKKKKRRKASEIQRNFKCHYQTCGKYYGTQTSLRNHLKIKHKIQ